ncbi:hypothetical protein [Pseudomonas baetica]|uniref:hypothetical protein n=1 Tax=Pseudomonas baetica TaxID=674054 RepID=UPI002871C178|nr:hypothetical protein [Pseudomonas baetica]MDR9861169.1 hypothetical protein [Pseudomonas baetica]
MTTTSQYTTGIMSATVSGSESATFKTTTDLLITKGPELLHISAHAQGTGMSVVFSIDPRQLPGTGEETTFLLSSEMGENQAGAAFIKDPWMLPAKQGALTIRYVESEKRLIGTFKFSTVGSGVSFELTEGAFDLVGVVESGVNRVQTFTADLKDIPATKFEAETISVTYIEQMLSITVDQNVHEDGTDSYYHRIMLFIPDGIGEGIHTFKSADYTGLRASYRRGGLNYITDEGQLELTEDPSEHRVVAKLWFKAKVDQQDKHVMTLLNGIIDYSA